MSYFGPQGYRWSGIEPLLMRCWPAVCGAASRLWSDREIRHDDVCAELGLSTDTETRAVELSVIRSGGTPGSLRVRPLEWGSRSWHSQN